MMKKWVRGLCTLVMVAFMLVTLPSESAFMISYASEEMVNKDGLERVIQSAEKIMPDSYYESSYEVLQSAIKDAREVLEDEDATQEDVDIAMLQVSDAIAGLQEKLPFVVLLVLGVAVAFVIGSAIVYLVVKAKERRQNDFECRINEQNSLHTQKATVESNRVRRNEAAESSDAGREKKTNNEVSEASATAEYVCEATTILNQDMGATAVLYQPQPKYEPKAYLLRLRTGERIEITKPEFVLGKDYTVSDYCLEGNSAISRAHVAIIEKETEFELADKKATNGTYVNGLRVMEPWNVVIMDGDILKLADEEFEFHYIEK